MASADAGILRLPAGLYRGTVEGPESGHCDARVEARRIPGGCVSLDYEAFGAEGLQHVEHTLVGPGVLHVAHSEAPGITVFTESAPGVYDAAPAGPYAQRLVVGWDGTELTWSWHWSPAGTAPTERSTATLRPASH